MRACLFPCCLSLAFCFAVFPPEGWQPVDVFILALLSGSPRILLTRYPEKMLVPGITASQLFVYARDAALFKPLFFSGDRANDLTLVKTQEIMQFPRNDDLLFNHVWGKSLRDGSANLFGIRRHSDLSLCPVKAIELYVAISSALFVDLLAGYLFRPLSSAGKIQNKQIANSTLQSRLRCYLQAKIYNGETLHNFRDGPFG